jgi:hypothetical protein
MAKKNTTTETIPTPEATTNSEAKTAITITQPADTAIPPKVFKRNEHGLINDGSVKYIYKEDGKIDWRKMIKSEFLVPNKQYFQRVGKSIPETAEGLADHELLILLSGIKDLARIRGYSDVRPTIIAPSPDYVAATCTITWVPNYEAEMKIQTFGDAGDATPINCNGFGKNYLATIAFNRAFVRAVRNYLGINIISSEEIGAIQEPIEDTSSNQLKEVMDKYNVSFEVIKKKLIEEQVNGAESFTNVNQIPRYKQFELTERIRKKAAEKGQ